MRNKFRGKRIDNGEWAYGFYTEDAGINSFIVCEGSFRKYRVDPETVGQFTGLNDKNGKEIYEGDIVEVYTNHIRDLDPDRGDKKYTHKVWFDEYEACFKFDDMTMCYRFLKEATSIEVIGNIHDNELI